MSKAARSSLPLSSKGLGVRETAPLGNAGIPLTSAHLLHVATTSGAAALGLAGQVGEFSIGSKFDAVWLRPVDGSTLDCGLRNADSADAALAKVFALGTDADVAGVWIGGVQVSR